MRYHRTGEFRAPKKREWFEQFGTCEPLYASEDWFSSRWILREAPEEDEPFVPGPWVAAHEAVKTERDKLKARVEWLEGSTPVVQNEQARNILGAGPNECVHDAAKRIVADRDEAKRLRTMCERELNHICDVIAGNPITTDDDGWSGAFVEATKLKAERNELKQKLHEAKQDLLGTNDAKHEWINEACRQAEKAKAPCDFLAEARAVVEEAKHLSSMRWCDVVVISQNQWDSIMKRVDALAAKLPKEAP